MPDDATLQSDELDPASAPSQPAEGAAGDTEGQTQSTTQAADEWRPPANQAELDSIIQREKAKAEARAERRAEHAYRKILERLVPQQQSMQGDEIQRPKPEQFSDTDSYIEALADWKYSQRESVARRARLEEQNRTLVQKTEAIYAKAHQEPGFDREAFDSLPLTPVISQAVTDSDIAPKLMTYMANHPEEVQRISALSPARQAAEIGRMEARLTAAPPPPKPSDAPPPITPVGANRGGSKDPSEMNEQEHAEWRRKRIAARR